MKFSRFKKRLRKSVKKFNKRFPPNKARSIKPRASAAELGGTTVYFNVERNLKPHWIAKTSYGCYNIVPSTAAGSYLWDFDPISSSPSGIFGQVIDNVAGGHTTPLPAITDAAALISLFDEYMVRKIVITAKLIDIGNVLGSNVIILGRYNYDSTAVPATINVQEIANVKQHTFTNEHPMCTYEIYPRMDTAILVNNGVTLSTSSVGRRVTKPSWLDIDRSVGLNGFFMYQNGTAASQTLSFDVTYYMGFRYHS